MRISLVMPNYNHASYLAASIGGMLSQTRPADEIIIIDDASTDTSLAEIERLTAGNDRVRIVRNETRGGAVKALNAGLALATGDAIAFLGADDEVRPEFIATLAQLMEAHPQAALGCARIEVRNQFGNSAGVRPIVRPRARAGYTSPAGVRRQLQHADNFFLGQVSLYRTAPLRELGGFDASLGSLTDSVLLRRLAVRWGYVFAPDILGIWREHGSNYSFLSVTDFDTLERMITNGKRVFGAEPASSYPDGYPALFERRLRFNTARLLVSRSTERAIDARALVDVMRGNRLDASVITGLARLGRRAQWPLIGWIALRLRPFAASWLLSEAGLRVLDRLQPNTPQERARP